jgi:hypothetical protein
LTLYLSLGGSPPLAQDLKQQISIKFDTYFRGIRLLSSLPNRPAGGGAKKTEFDRFSYLLKTEVEEAQ